MAAEAVKPSPAGASRSLTLTIPAELAGQRLDAALARLLPDFSRARLTQWVRAGQVQVDQALCRPSDHVSGGEQVQLTLVFPRTEQWHAQDLPLRVLYEDADILVVEKAAGVVVHPGAGNPEGTLLNALLHHAPELASVPRAGLVHRLDKDTSGLLVVARTLAAHRSLVEQIKSHGVSREYHAIVTGVLTAGGRIDAPIGRHPQQRVKMAVVARGKPATTHYRVLRRFPAHTHLRVLLETGRTHQIRVHMAHIGFPLLGDPVYGGRPRLPPGCDAESADLLRGFRRQALHAARLELEHPGRRLRLSWESPLPDDLSALLQALGRQG